MDRSLKVLMIILALYFAPSLFLKATYGESYSLWSSENSWIPDGKGDWKEFGNPKEVKPDEPSQVVPLWLLYIPIFLPTFFLILVMFTPLFKELDHNRNRPPDKKPEPEIDSQD